MVKLKSSKLVVFNLTLTSCYDHWTLVNDHIIVVERKKREHIKNLFFSHNNIFNKKYECQRKDFKILYNFFFKPEKSLTVNC